MKVVIICGYPGVGKSTFCRLATDHDVGVIDCDQIVKDLYRPFMPGWKALHRLLGPEYFDSSSCLNLSKLRNYVFSGMDNLMIINKLIHPLVRNRVKNLLKKNHKYIVFVESVYPKVLSGFYDLTIEIKRDINSAKSQAKKRGINTKMYNFITQVLTDNLTPDVIIENNGNLIDLAAKLDALLIRIKNA